MRMDGVIFLCMLLAGKCTLFIWVITACSSGVATSISFSTEDSLVELIEDVTQQELCVQLDPSTEMTVVAIIYQSISALGKVP